MFSTFSIIFLTCWHFFSLSKLVFGWCNYYQKKSTFYSNFLPHQIGTNWPNWLTETTVSTCLQVPNFSAAGKMTDDFLWTTVITDLLRSWAVCLTTNYYKQLKDRHSLNQFTRQFLPFVLCCRVYQAKKPSVEPESGPSSGPDSSTTYLNSIAVHDVTKEILTIMYILSNISEIILKKRDSCSFVNLISR